MALVTADSDMEVDSAMADDNLPQQPLSTKNTIPAGLKPSQHLLGPSNYTTWARAMLALFRANGVLRIMRDAIIRAGDDDAQKELLAARPAGSPISGATKLTSAYLDVWDDSDDMTLLLKADALIDSSIGDDATARVIGVENVHTKWEVLAMWKRDWRGTKEGYDIQEERLTTMCIGDFPTVDDFIKEFMGLRAGMIMSDPRRAGWVSWVHILEDAALRSGTSVGRGLNHPDNRDPTLILMDMGRRTCHELELGYQGCRGGGGSEGKGSI